MFIQSQIDVYQFEQIKLNFFHSIVNMVTLYGSVGINAETIYDLCKPAKDYKITKDGSRITYIDSGKFSCRISSLGLVFPIGNPVLQLRLIDTSTAYALDLSSVMRGFEIKIMRGTFRSFSDLIKRHKPNCQIEFRHLLLGNPMSDLLAKYLLSSNLKKETLDELGERVTGIKKDYSNFDASYFINPGNVVAQYSTDSLIYKYIRNGRVQFELRKTSRSGFSLKL